MTASINHVIHIIPVGDLRIHDAQMDCWCFPLSKEPCIYVHNAKDCREAKERQGVVGASPGWILIGEKI